MCQPGAVHPPARSCAACHLGFAVGTFRLLADTPARRRKKGKQASQQQQQQQQQQAADDRQLTHFAPLEVPPDLEVAAVLAVPPSTSVEDSDADKAAAAAAYGLPRSSHFFGLAFSLFEEVLGTRCPLPAMQQVGWLGRGARAGAGAGGWTRRDKVQRWVRQVQDEAASLHTPLV
jgi:hypothetical protein